MYIVCWTPIIAFTSVLVASDPEHDLVNAEIRILVLAIACIPSAIDPLLYAFISPVITKIGKQFIKRLPCNSQSIHVM